MTAEGQTGRPTKLGRGFLIFSGSVLLVEFVTGIALWRVHELLEDGIQPASWAGPVRAIHGILTPLLSGLFGYLFYVHIPLGWRMKANRWSGAIMVLFFVVLIGSGMGIYYSGDPHFHASVHITGGFLLPFFLAWHTISGWRWAK